MNPDLEKLHPYPFEKLAALKTGLTPPAHKPPILLSVGEPQDPAPHFVTEALIAHLHGLMKYPTTRGLPGLREAIAEWLAGRFGIPAPDPEREVLPVSGTREALFSFAQCILDRSRSGLVLLPNPFYQIYEGAALLAGCQPYYLNTPAETGYLPDFEAVPDSVWERCQLLYLCSPGNPCGAVAPLPVLQQLLEKALRYDFIIAADECYSEIYPQESSPPPGLLQAAHAMGNNSFKNCVVFHSLSKRSNLPGLRSGFVAGDGRILERYFLYRTYQGCAMPLQTQHASRIAWQDENHVRANRANYRARFDAVLPILEPVCQLQRPQAGFYLWPRTPISDTDFAARLYARENVTVLPGSFLSRSAGDVNPGRNHVRIALVAPLEDCVEAATRIRQFIESL